MADLLRAPALVGGALTVFGASVVAGWLWRHPVAFQRAPDLPPMVLNSGVCLVLAGGWLLVATLRPDWKAATRVLAALLFVVPAVIALQYAVGADFGIDAAALHRPFDPDQAHPGRMSLFTAGAFAMASLAMLLVAAPARAGRDALALGLASGTGLAGVLALLGYLLELHLIYGRPPFGLTALDSAIALIALSLALWFHLVRARRVRFWERLAAQDRITFAAAAILTLVSLAVGVGVFAAMQARVQRTLRDGLGLALRYRVSLAQSFIEAGVQRSRILVGRPAPARALRAHLARPGDPQPVARLAQSALSLVSEGDRAATYYDPGGRVIASAGRPLGERAMRVPLRATQGATLAWQDGFVLSGRYTLADRRGPVGSARVQVPLPGLDALMLGAGQLRGRGALALCAGYDARIACFPVPNGAHPTAQAATGTALPLARALAGEAGVAVAHDASGAHLMVAFAPVGALGLAMTFEAQSAEVFAPIRERLQSVLSMMVLIVVAGTLLARAAVRPLAARLAQSERTAHDQHAVLEHMMAGVAEGIMLTDADGTIRAWNPAAARLFGYTAEEVIGRNISMLVPEELREANIAATQRYVQTGESNVLGHANQNYPGLRKDGSKFEIEFTVTALAGEHSGQLVAVFRDITARKRAEERLTRLALHDGLTGLPNRMNFEQRLEEAFARCRRSRATLAVMTMDLDNLKPVNDRFGHDAGDRLLVAVAQRLKAAVRETDLAARIGGDEFAAVLESLTRPEDAGIIAEKVLASLAEPVQVEGRPVAISASIGVALCREGDTTQALIKRADRALYEAKGEGGARYRVAA